MVTWLQTQKGDTKETLPSVRTMRDLLNRLGYRLRRIQKAKPLKQTKQTDAICANGQAVREEGKEDPETLEISLDTKAKVNEGDYARGGNPRTDSSGETEKGWDPDPPAKRKWAPLGIWVLRTGALTLFLGSKETSDFGVDGLQRWWEQTRTVHRQVRQLVIYLDHGPNHSGTRTPFLKRMVEFADWSGVRVRLVYYPPYPSNYNPIERCWSSLEIKWGGVLLNCLTGILPMALRMRWRGLHPVVKRLEGDYPDGIKLSKKAMRPYEARWERSKTLPKYDITITPTKARSG